MKYLCCTPSCGNILEPQGPIFMMISYEQGSTPWLAELNDDATVVKPQLENIIQVLPDNIFQFDIAFNHPFVGKEALFHIEKYTVSLSPGRDSAQSSTKLRICCHKCKKCCDYNY